ncbi:DNA-binding response regulator, partial [Streptomyces rhizosphaericola]
MLRVLAVDDEPPALEELLYLLRADPRVRSAEGATGATEARGRHGGAVLAAPQHPPPHDVGLLENHNA